MIARTFIPFALLAVALAAHSPWSAQSQGEPVDWPTGGWQASTPAEHGMDPAPLLRMLQWLQEQNKNVHSILIVRDGYLVLEAYFPPYSAETRHNIYSATKTVTGTLVGIAIQQGSLNSVDERVLADLYPELKIANPDPRKQKITLRHLLEMSSGIAWNETGISYANRRNPVSGMHSSDDWVQYFLDQPIISEPGTRFQYNSGGSHLLSAILQKQTGISTADFAAENLFGPLGFSETYWPVDPNSIHLGSSGLQLIPRDLAKLGFLYLQDGIWEGKRLLPEGWVREATSKRQVAVSPKLPRIRLSNFLNRVFRPGAPEILGMDYGYQWWLPSFGGYAARGWSGQALFVHPALDLVVVFTGGLGGADNFLPDQLMVDYILPAAQPQNGQTDHSKATEQLQSLVASLAQVEPQAQHLPDTASRISGRKIHFSPRRGSIQSLSLTFGREAQAALTFVQGNSTYEVQIGLDGVYRFNPISEAETLALLGSWIDEQIFSIEWRALSSGDRNEIQLTFEGERVKIRSRSELTGRVERMTGELEP